MKQKTFEVTVALIFSLELFIDVMIVVLVDHVLLLFVL